MAKLLVNIDVPDLERAARFYTHALELRPGRRIGSDALELIGAEVPINLLLKAAGTRPYPDAAGVREYARHWSPVHLDFGVRDLEAALARALAAGATQEGEIEQYGW